MLLCFYFYSYFNTIADTLDHKKAGEETRPLHPSSFSFHPSISTHYTHRRNTFDIPPHSPPRPRRIRDTGRLQRIQMWDRVIAVGRVQKQYTHHLIEKLLRKHSTKAERLLFSAVNYAQGMDLQQRVAGIVVS